MATPARNRDRSPLPRRAFHPYPAGVSTARVEYDVLHTIDSAAEVTGDDHQPRSHSFHAHRARLWRAARRSPAPFAQGRGTGARDRPHGRRRPLLHRRAHPGQRRHPGVARSGCRPARRPCTPLRARRRSIRPRRPRRTEIRRTRRRVAPGAAPMASGIALRRTRPNPLSMVSERLGRSLRVDTSHASTRSPRRARQIADATIMRRQPKLAAVVRATASSFRPCRKRPLAHRCGPWAPPVTPWQNPR